MLLAMAVARLGARCGEADRGIVAHAAAWPYAVVSVAQDPCRPAQHRHGRLRLGAGRGVELARRRRLAPQELCESLSRGEGPGLPGEVARRSSPRAALRRREALAATRRHRTRLGTRRSRRWGRTAAATSRCCARRSPAPACPSRGTAPSTSASTTPEPQRHREPHQAGPLDRRPPRPLARRRSQGRARRRLRDDAKSTPIDACTASARRTLGSTGKCWEGDQSVHRVCGRDRLCRRWRLTTDPEQEGHPLGRSTTSSQAHRGVRRHGPVQGGRRLGHRRGLDRARQ